ncbi:MAG: hypothetical protein ACR2M6_03545 [Vampirovibrionia bacterium]
MYEAQNQTLNAGGILGNKKKLETENKELKIKIAILLNEERVGRISKINNFKNFGEILDTKNYDNPFYFNKKTSNVEWNQIEEGKKYKFCIQNSQNPNFLFQAKIISIIDECQIFRIPNSRKSLIIHSSVKENKPISKPRPTPRPRTVLHYLNLTEEQAKSIKIESGKELCCPYDCNFNGRSTLHGFLSHLGKLKNHEKNNGVGANNCRLNPSNEHSAKWCKNNKIFTDRELAEHLKQIIIIPNSN